MAEVDDLAEQHGDDVHRMNKVHTYGRDDVIADIAALIAGLQVPVSLGGRQYLGQGYDPWHRLFEKLHSFGWVDAEQIEKELRAVLDDHPATQPKPERNIKLWVRLPETGWIQRGSYSSVGSAKRGVRKWHESHSSVSTYIQLPGEAGPWAGHSEPAT
jgi:hypothetical protein